MSLRHDLSRLSANRQAIQKFLNRQCARVTAIYMLKDLRHDALVRLSDHTHEDKDD